MILLYGREDHGEFRGLCKGIFIRSGFCFFECHRHGFRVCYFMGRGDLAKVFLYPLFCLHRVIVSGNDQCGIVGSVPFFMEFMHVF